MSWSAIPGIYRKFEADATIAGKMWVVGSIACRYVAQYSFGGSVYADEQAKFYCDPGEIGIKNLCFSKFSPISFHRFWVAQIIGTSLPLIAYVVTVTHVTLWIEEKKADQLKITRERRKRIKQELRFPWQANQSFENHVNIEGETPISKENGLNHESAEDHNRSPWQIGKPMINRNNAINDLNTNIMFRDYQQDVIESESSEYESDYEDFLFDFVYGDPDSASLKSYGKLSSDFVLCPKKAEIRDCCCHWPKSARKRSIILTRFYIFCAFWRLGMELSFFYLQQKYYISPVPDVFDCEMRGMMRKCFTSRASEKTLFRTVAYYSSIFLTSCALLECLQLMICFKVPFFKTGSRALDQNRAWFNRDQPEVYFICNHNCVAIGRAIRSCFRFVVSLIMNCKAPSRRESNLSYQRSSCGERIGLTNGHLTNSTRLKHFHETILSS